MSVRQRQKATGATKQAYLQAAAAARQAYIQATAQGGIAMKYEVRKATDKTGGTLAGGLMSVGALCIKDSKGTRARYDDLAEAQAQAQGEEVGAVVVRVADGAQWAEGIGWLDGEGNEIV